MKLSEVAKRLGAIAPESLGEREPLGYSIDSRTIRAGDLFFAIRGEQYNGHQFVADVLNKGVIAAVVSRNFQPEQADGLFHNEALLIRVDDTLVALQQLASAEQRNWRGQEVAITGSMGKTTTKEMTAAALTVAGRVIKSTGNLNNDYGLPLSILKMESDGAHADDFDYAVFEMGMNHQGEIARLASIAPPVCGVVTVVAPVHLEFFDSVEGIAAAKAELVAGIKAGGVAVLNADDPRVARMREMRSDIAYRMFGIESPADVTARNLESHGLSGTRFRLVTPRGETEVKLAVAGRHNVYNALAAAAVADYYNAPLDGIAEALAESASPRMRGEVLRLANDITLVDDSYNSNPRALVEMVRTISANRDDQRRIVVAGEMLELGATGAALHHEAGRQIAQFGIDLLIGVRGLAAEIVEGARAAGMSTATTIFCATPDEAADVLQRQARAGDLILVKGSRGVKTEIVVERMKKQWSVVSGQ
ncbi:MAG: UDP-N-acetylmuramoyl-tripeptide--D-alanyl-D-alanine ligase [Blastocatellia bacterium]